jgi:hypothetical protein
MATHSARYLVIFLLLPSVLALAAQKPLQIAASELPDRDVTITAKGPQIDSLVCHAYVCMYVPMHLCAVRHAHQTARLQSVNTALNHCLEAHWL